MDTSIHPYKGYLNTQYRIFVKGEEPLRFQVYSADKEDGQAVLDGVVEPNQPYSINMQSAGEYVIKFEDDSTHNFRVEDGYRYGGNKLKNAFIFDECPWAFVVMHDRTYFYNRQNDQSYVEPISPDEITEISYSFVLLKSEKLSEITLFSLEEQRPVLWVDNVTFHNNKVLCWTDKNEGSEDENNSIIVVFSLSEQRIVSRSTCDKYSFDEKSNSLYYHSAGQIHRIDLDTYDDRIVHRYNGRQKFMTFVSMHYAIAYESYRKKLYILDLRDGETRGEVYVQGELARVNDVSLIKINDKAQLLRNFDFATFRIPEALIQAQYVEIDFYPCDWDIDANFGCQFRTLYAERLTTFQVFQGQYHNNKFNRTEEAKIKSAEANFSHMINDINGTVITNENYFHFFNSRESLVIPRLYPNSVSYHKEKEFLQAGGTVIMKCDDEVRFLNDRGLWDGQLLGRYDTSLFETFKVLKNIDNRICYDLFGTELGTLLSRCCMPSKRLGIGVFTVYPGGEYVKASDSPQFLSTHGQFGLMVNEAGVTLFEIHDHIATRTSQILQDVFETQNYANVLLGENGRQVIYRDGKQSKMLDLASGVISEFDNLSFINHINGIRPLFRLRETSQALLINPVDGQPIDFDLLNEYQFVSPNYQLYADKALSKYVEYYDHIQQRLISREQYLQIYEMFDLETSDDVEREQRVQNRIDFVQRNSDYFLEVLRCRWHMEGSIVEHHNFIINRNNALGTSHFIDFFIEKRGVAVIRRVSDDVEVARIQLGAPLWFLNYVSFSRDSRYVSIAGRYPNDSSYSGLFLVYDLAEQNTIIDSKSSFAVWTTAFTNNDIVAAYTSTPNSFVGSISGHRVFSDEEVRPVIDKDFNVRNLSFLTFSPDGKFFACSHQGYLCYMRPNGTVRPNWGHQPSSLVSIRNTDNPQVELLALCDLSDEGIADTNVKQSVASVSFSNDNSRIMMVGRNGVVIVRNIHL